MLPPQTDHPTATVSRKLLMLALLAAGGLLWFRFIQRDDAGLYRRGKIQWNWPPFWAMGAAAVCLIPQVTRAVLHLLDKVRHPSSTARRWTMLLLAISAAAYFIVAGLLQHRDFYPRNHDEHMYLLQARMLADGKLWMPQHAVADFFETFHVLVKPRYAAIYFPGTALLYVPAIWIGAPAWSISIGICGLIVGLTYRVITEVLDGTAGLTAAIALATLPRFRLLSLMVMSHTTVLMLGLLMTWAWLRWRREDSSRRRLVYAALFGLFAGWSGITRPLDGLCFAVPIGIAMLFDLRRFSGSLFSTLAVIALAAAPLLALQLIEDKGITGHVGQTPATLYANEYWPELNLGFHAYVPARRLPTELPQIQAYYREFIAPRVNEHRPERVIHTLLHDRLPMTLSATLPTALLAILIPPALLCLTDRRRWVIALVLPLLLLAYMPFLFYLRHYTLMAAPAVLLLVLLGGHAIENTFPAVRRFTASMVPVIILLFSVINTVTLQRATRDAAPSSDVLKDVRAKLAALPHEPAVVLFAFQPGDNYLEEPVYNLDVSNIDDAPIIRAHDLGARNPEVFRYYAATAPGRVFYRYRRAQHGEPSTLTRLGTARELAGGMGVP